MYNFIVNIVVNIAVNKKMRLYYYSHTHFHSVLCNKIKKYINIHHIKHIRNYLI
jgi:hypothetical protein